MILVESDRLYCALNYKADIKHRKRYQLYSSDYHCICKDYNIIAIILANKIRSYSFKQDGIYYLSGKLRVIGNIYASDSCKIDIGIPLNYITIEFARSKVRLKYDILGNTILPTDIAFNFALRTNRIYLDNLVVYEFRDLHLHTKMNYSKFII